MKLTKLSSRSLKSDLVESSKLRTSLAMANFISNWANFIPEIFSENLHNLNFSRGFGEMVLYWKYGHISDYEILNTSGIMPS